MPQRFFDIIANNAKQIACCFISTLINTNQRDRVSRCYAWFISLLIHDNFISFYQFSITAKHSTRNLHETARSRETQIPRKVLRAYDPPRLPRFPRSSKNFVIVTKKLLWHVTDARQASCERRSAVYAPNINKPAAVTLTTLVAHWRSYFHGAKIHVNAAS